MWTKTPLMAMSWLLAFALGISGGCSSDPKDPFEEWGAATKYEEFVPPTARPVASGAGVLDYTAPEDGVLYVLETTSTVMIEGVAKPKVVASGYLTSGTHVTFEPSERRARVEGREGVRLTEVTPGHVHELRFDPVRKK
jgi:hypothetical protein